MNNTTLSSADGATHLKIVAVSLIAAIIVVGVGIAASPNFNDGTADPKRIEATGPVIKAGKPTAFSAREGAAIR